MLLLRELVRSNCEAFVSCWAAESMHLDLNSGDVSGSVHARSVDDFERAVHVKYPEAEAHLPLDARRVSIPQGIQDEIK